MGVLVQFHGKQLVKCVFHACLTNHILLFMCKSGVFISILLVILPLTDFLSMCHVGPVSNIFKFLVQIFLLSWPPSQDTRTGNRTLHNFITFQPENLTKLKLFLTKKGLKILQEFNSLTFLEIKQNTLANRKEDRSKTIQIYLLKISKFM